MKYPTLYSLFAARVKEYAGEKDVFYFRSNDTWQGISWRRFEEETYDFATALLSFNLQRGGSICILMGNVPEWPISDIGTIMAGGVVSVFTQRALRNRSRTSSIIRMLSLCWSTRLSNFRRCSAFASSFRKSVTSSR